LASAKKEFEAQIERARTALSPVAVTVPNFKPSDTDDRDGEMAKFGKLLNGKAAELVATVSEDLASDLVLGDPKVQQRIAVALDGAEKDLDDGLPGLATWRLVERIALAMSEAERTTARAVVTAAKHAIDTAIEYFHKQQADSKFRLKAAGAHWHNDHLMGPIENCPLCDISLKENTTLRQELEALRSAGNAATRRMEDNVNAILTALAEAVPHDLRRLLDDVLPLRPRAEMEKDYRRKFVEADRYAKCLVKFTAIAEAAIDRMPSDELADATPQIAPLPAATPVAKRLEQIERMCRLAEWHEAQVHRWSEWWAKLTPSEDTGDERNQPAPHRPSSRREAFNSDDEKDRWCSL
jgi:hypothetical protein